MKHNIYILRTYLKEGTLIKVGYASDIDKRFAQYQSHNPSVELIYTFYKQDGILFEQTLHDNFKASYKREWYSEEDLPKILEWIDNTTQITQKTIKLSKREKTKLTPLDKVRLGLKANFAMLCEQYFELKNKNTIANRLEARDIELLKPLIKEAYEVLGEDKMKKIGLKANEIENELITQNALKSADWKIVKLLDLRIGEWTSLVDVKEKIRIAYNKLNITKAPKASDLSKWYDIQNKSKRVDGVLLKGLIIIANKINLK